MPRAIAGHDLHGAIGGTVERVLAAQQAAEKALEGASAETDVARAQAELEEARARYRAAQKLKGKR